MKTCRVTDVLNMVDQIAPYELAEEWITPVSCLAGRMRR